MRRDSDDKIPYDYVVDALTAEDKRNELLNLTTALTAEEVQYQIWNDPLGEKAHHNKKVKNDPLNTRHKERHVAVAQR